MLLDAIEQGFGLKRFPEKAFGAHRDRFIAQMLVGQGRDEDHRGPAALLRELSCEFKPIHSGHMHIGDDTIEQQQVSRCQERLCRRKSLSAMAHGKHQIHQRQTQSFVVVDDCNKRVLHGTDPREMEGISLRW